MSGADNVDFNNLERALSSDIDNLQSMEARFLSDLLAQVLSTKGVSAGSGVPTSTIADRVLGGLIASVSATPNSVDVSAGALCQYSTTLSPVPGALDSNYRMAINRSVATLTAPAPVGNTYYLLEAQMVNVVTSTQNRDIFNPGTGLFVSTPVTKLQERRVQFQFTAGTATAAPAPTTSWVPIAIVYRAGGGGAVNAADILDVRPLWTQGATLEGATNKGALIKGFFAPTSVPGATTENGQFDLEAIVRGQRLFARTTAARSLGTADIVENGLVYSNGRLYYIYLAPWRSQYLPTNRLTSVEQRGIVVISAVAPDADGFNTGAITPPGPFAGANIAIGEAFCVAAGWRSGGDWMPQTQTANGTFVAPYVGSTENTMVVGAAVGSGNLDFDLATLAAGSTPMIPPHAKSVSLQFQCDGLGTNMAAVIYQISGSGQPYNAVSSSRSADAPVVTLPVGQQRAFRAVIIGLDTANMSVVGWSL